MNFRTSQAHPTCKTTPCRPIIILYDPKSGSGVLVNKCVLVNTGVLVKKGALDSIKGVGFDKGSWIRDLYIQKKLG